MVKIKVMFFSWDTSYSKIIKKVTKCKWSHVGIAIDNGEEYIVYEAINKGLVKSNYSKEFINKRIEDKIILIQEADYEIGKSKLIEICDKYLGTPYDWISIINIYLYMITKHSLNIGGVKAVFCSEFASRVLYEATNKKVDFEKEYNKSFDLITPEDMFKSKQLKSDSKYTKEGYIQVKD